MPTVSFIQKLPIKALKKSFLWGLSAAISLLLIFNIILLSSKARITTIVNNYFPTKVSLMHVYSFWPNEIVLKNVSISNSNIEQDHTFLLPKMVIRFPFFDSLRSRSITIDEVIVEQPSVNFNRLGLYLKDHALALKVILDSLPKNNLTVDVRKAKVNMALENILPDLVDADMELLIKHPSIQLKGSFLRKGQAKEKIPLTILFEGDAQPSEFFINKIDIKGQHINSNLWGSVKGNMIDLNGFLIFDLLGREIPKKQKWFSKNSPPSSSSQAGQTIYLLDVKTKVFLFFPDIVVKLFEFTVNNRPVIASGTISLKHLPEFEFHAGHVNTQEAPGSVTLSEAEFFAAGQYAYRKLLFDSELILNYKSRIIDKTVLTTVSADFDNVEVQFRPSDLNRSSSEAHIRVGRSVVEYVQPDLAQKLQISKLKAIYAQDKDNKGQLTFDAPFYEGDLKGRVWIDPAQEASTVKTILWIKNAEANRLSELYPHFAKIYGRLDGKIDILNKPKMDVLGEISIVQGRLVDFEFFKWLAERFRLSALKDLNFDSASSSFYLNRSGSGLTDISLNSEGVHLGGNFEVNRNRLVTSKIMLRFTKDLLKQSPKFTPLLKLFEEDELRFDFQLSGNENAMNFQWLSSEVKQKIQDRIPDFIERHIERRIDEGLEEEQEGEGEQVQESTSNITVETRTEETEGEILKKGEQK